MTDFVVPNRKPLIQTPFLELPLGAIKPSGWLRDQLEIQSEGMTGKLDEHWPYLGPESGWLGGLGESWERGPYYLDGLLPLAYILENEELLEKIKPWIEWTLGSQQENGMFGPPTNIDWWPRMVMMKVLIQHEEATGDSRVIPFLSKYLHYQLLHIDERPLSDWSEARGGESLLSIQWVYNRTGEAFLLELVDKFLKQTTDWTGIFTKFPYWRYQTQFDHRIHVVNVAMGLKEPAVRYLYTGESVHHDAAYIGLESLKKYHGQVHGMWSGDEWLAGTHPSQGVELCSVVETMFTFEHLVRIFGDGIFGDMLEKLAFNALPATIAADWNSHQYVQQVNQISCTSQHRNWTENGNDANIFGLEPNFGCCTANMHQGWPKFAARLWMATEDRGLAAISYAPCQVSASVGHGVIANLRVEGGYPFGEKVTIALNLSEDSVAFPLRLRIPQWCLSPEIFVNGQAVSISIIKGFMTIDRLWNTGDQILVSLPMIVVADPRANNAMGVNRGPLVYALPLKEHWNKLYGNMPFETWEVNPVEPDLWNYGLLVKDQDRIDLSFEYVSEKSLARQPFSAENPPSRLLCKGRRLPTWQMAKNSAGELPLSPVKSDSSLEDLVLIPYGAARLRIGEFPTIKK